MAGRTRKIVAASIHLLTASGAAWALLALLAISAGRYEQALGWMLLALLVDSVDGTLARRFRVREVMPGIDGDRLDNMIDYLTYAVVPAYFVLGAGLLPSGAVLAGAVAICVAAGFQLSHAEAKTHDHLFRGFPSYWNVVVFYLLVLGLPRAVNLMIVGVLVVLSFAPLYCVYPSRTARLRPLTLALTLAWGICLVVLLVRYPDHASWLAYVSLLYPFYYFLLSLGLTMERLKGKGHVER